MPRTMKTAQEALRDRLFAGFLARAYRSQAREGIRLLWRAPMRVEEQGWTRIKAMERISEPIIGRKTDGGAFGRPRTAASRRSDSQNVRPNGFHFPPYGRRIRAGRRPGGPTNQRVRDPVGAESSCATQPVFNGEAKRQSTPREYLPGGRGSFSNSTLNEVFRP